jgi:hypothetical protein
MTRLNSSAERRALFLPPAEVFKSLPFFSSQTRYPFGWLAEFHFLARAASRSAVIIRRGCGRKVHALQPLGISHDSTFLYIGGSLILCFC